MRVGSRVVVTKGSRRGRVGRVVEVGGKCGGEPACMVALEGKRCTQVTFFPESHLAELK